MVESGGVDSVVLEDATLGGAGVAALGGGGRGEGVGDRRRGSGLNKVYEEEKKNENK